MITTTSSPSLASPSAAPGTSAPVLEYICLFTHDLRRKQKRWQDGRLKYHTFNRRVMAYDDRGNFIGDMHWRSDWDFDVGEEIQLERGGIIVQVADCIGQQSQDLSELVDKRIQDREQRVREKERRRVTAAPSRQPLSASARGLEPQRQQPPSEPQQIRHRPLTALVGTPTGHHGRALVPSDSPFEQRKKADDLATEDNAHRPVKRRRYEDAAPSKMGYAQSLFGATLMLSGAPPSSTRLPSQPLPRHTIERQPARLSPESEDHSMVNTRSSNDYDNPSRRGPLRVVRNDRRINHVISAKELLPLTKEAHSEISPPPPGETNQVLRGCFPKQASKSTGRPKEITDLTLSDDDGGSNNTTVPEESIGIDADNHARRGRSRRVGGEGGGITRNRSSVQSELARTAVPTSTGTEANLGSLEPDIGMHDENPRKTELRLRSRKKRGLLVVSEQAKPKPIQGNSEQTMPAQTSRSVSGNLFPQEAQPETDTELLHRFSEQRTRRDYVSETPSLDVNPHTVESTRRKEEAHAHIGAKSQDNTKQTARDEVEHYDPMDEVDISASKSRNKRRRRTLPTVAEPAEPADGPVGEQQCEPGKNTRSSTNAGEQQPTTTTEAGDTSMEQHTAMPDKVGAVAAAPRLVKLSRKSIRSKELIGFVIEDADTSGGNGTFSANTSYVARVKGQQEASRIRPAAVSAGPVLSAGEGAENIALEHNSEVASGVNLHRSASRLSPSPCQDLSSPQSNTLKTSRDSKTTDTSTDRPPLQERSRERSQEPQAAVEEIPALATTLAESAHSEQVARGSSSRASVGQDNGANISMITKDGQLGVTCEERAGRLVNPATRGRKAALKAHAAGQVPQPVLPADLGMQAVQREQPKTTTSATGRAPPKIKMTFPGFISAKAGGPWSREAHDLLETGRPSEGPNNGMAG